MLKVVMFMKYESVNTPSELLEFMNEKISYGYIGKNKKKYLFNDNNFNSDWFDNYILESPREVLSNKVGNCYDQVELERNWFIKHNYEIKTFYIMVEVNYVNNYPTHVFLVFKENNGWNLFESADYINRGIFKFGSINELIDNQFKKQIQLIKSIDSNFNCLDKIHVYEYNKPKYNINAKEFIDYCINAKRVK